MNTDLNKEKLIIEELFIYLFIINYNIEKILFLLM